MDIALYNLERGEEGDCGELYAAIVPGHFVSLDTLLSPNRLSQDRGKLILRLLKC